MQIFDEHSSLKPHPVIIGDDKKVYMKLKVRSPLLKKEIRVEPSSEIVSVASRKPSQFLPNPKIGRVEALSEYSDILQQV